MFEVIVGTAVLIFTLVVCYFIGKYMSPMPNNSGKVITARDIIEIISLAVIQLEILSR